MREITTRGVSLTSISGSNASIKRAGKIILIPSNEIADITSRVLLDGDIVIVGVKTFVTLGDSTQYPDPYTNLAALPGSEFMVSVKPWVFVDKAKDERTTGFKITGIELIKGIFKIETGSVLKACNASFVFPKGKGTVKIEITSNAMHIGGSDAKITGPFTREPLNLTQFSEYIIVGSQFYKKSMLAMNEENRMDERFMALDALFLKVYGSAMSMSQKDLDNMDKSVESFNPSDISKGLDNAMNMDPEMLKQAGFGPEQLKQMTEGLARFKKEMTPDKVAMFKNALGGIKKEDMIKNTASMRKMIESAPKNTDLTTDFEVLPPYGPLPSRIGECEEAEV
ncbi:MAG: hypothetical protein WC307_02875 [Candidatus Nanoarchaeia archaeon]|jgi:hypothetical protein